MEQGKVYRYGGKVRADRAEVRPSGTGWLAKIVASVLAVAFVSLAAWWLWPKGAEPQPEDPAVKALKAPKAPKSVKEAKPAKPARDRNAEPRQERKAKRPERRPAASPAEGPKVISVVTNDAGFILTTVEENGRTNLLTDTVVKPVFRNPMHQLIAAAIGGAYESEMAPLPLGPGDDAALRAALKVEIPDLPDDTEAVRRLKEAVRATRKDMEALLDGGHTVEEILTQHRELWNENVKIRREMKEECRRLMAEGDGAAAAEYLERINRSFRDMGIPEMTPDELQPRGKRRREQR